MRLGGVRNRDLVKIANQVVRWQTAVLKSMEAGLSQGSFDDDRLEGIRGTMAGLADSRRPPPERDRPDWLLGRSKSFRDGYRLGDLTSVRAAVWVRTGRGLSGPYRDLNDHLGQYLIGTDRAAEAATGALNIATVHDGGCGRIAGGGGRLTWDEELAFARWIGDYWGVLPLAADPKIPKWLRVLNSLPDLSGDTLDTMMSQRSQRGWGDPEPLRGGR